MSGIRKDISGQRFGRLVAVRISDRPSRRSLWECKCDCGKIHDVLAQSLLAGIQKSCGCLRNEVAALNGKLTATHGITHTPRWSTWNRMLRFAKSKGIRVCDGIKSHPDVIFSILPSKPAKNTVRLIQDTGYFSCGSCASCNESGAPLNVKWGRELRSDRKAKIDLSGSVFGRLTAIKYSGDKKWMFNCNCGNVVIAESQAVKRGIQKSCGCHRRDVMKNNVPKNKTHGESKTSIGNTWFGMLRRCYNETSKYYHRYGGRGIKVCEYIRKSPNSIRDLIGDKVNGLSIDRIDNNGNYSCGNCEQCVENGWSKNIQWLNQSGQTRNTSRNRNVEINGEVHCITDWAKIVGISKGAFAKRLKSGWPVDKLLNPPNRLLR